MLVYLLNTNFNNSIIPVVMTIIEIVQQFKSLDVNSISMKSKHFKVPLECI